MIELLKQTENNLAIIFDDSSQLSPEDSKALQRVTALLQSRSHKEIEEWVKQRSSVQTPFSF